MQASLKTGRHGYCRPVKHVITGQVVIAQVIRRNGQLLAADGNAEGVAPGRQRLAEATGTIGSLRISGWSRSMPRVAVLGRQME